ncbi:MAG TPA: ATP-binding protein [Solirubrobacteraceae bacterium]|nr:ATP-binding protein [Solirubrobacteraceae bacterium]
MTETRAFPNAPQSVRAARKFALEALGGYPRETLEVVELLVSELAGNCVRHTSTRFVVGVSDDRGVIRIEVTDRGPGEPSVRHVDPSAISGRGLALVESLSQSWGVRHSRTGTSGKTVWFEVPTAARRGVNGWAARTGPA